MSQLELSNAIADGVAVITLAGELDLGGVETVERELRRLEAEPGQGAIVVDLRGLTFMDSSGLRMILRADERVRAQGRRFALVAGPEPVQRVFEITRMRERLEFVGDPTEAAA